MDKLARYREIIRQLIFDYASHKPANGQIETEAVIDSERDHYEVLHIGWDGVRRVHGLVINIDIMIKCGFNMMVLPSQWQRHY